MPAELGGGQGETAVPFDRAGQLPGRGVDRGAAVAGGRTRVRARCPDSRTWSGTGCARPGAGGPSRSAASRPAGPLAEVQRSVLGPGRRRTVVVGAGEDPAFPPPAVAVGVRGQAAVAGAGLELGPVDAVAAICSRIGVPAVRRSGWKFRVTRQDGSAGWPAASFVTCVMACALAWAGGGIGRVGAVGNGMSPCLRGAASYYEAGRLLYAPGLASAFARELGLDGPGAA